MEEDDQVSRRIVNVASVPMRSPFRYPGGKTWLVPRVREWIDACGGERQSFVEPFAGGGSVSLAVAADSLADHVTMAELDPDVGAVWETIINDPDGAPWLAERIAAFALTPTTLADLLATEPDSIREQAFRTIVRNRVARGGIMAPGAGIIRSGEGGRGLLSRWYPETLRRRIVDIARYRAQITFISGDGLDVLRARADEPDTLYFIDPPYSAAGKRAGRRLYAHPEIDHSELFRICSKLRGRFLMTYDNTEEIQEMAREYGFGVEFVAMRNAHNAAMSEVVISN